MYIELSTGNTYALHSEIRDMLKQVSLPEVLTDEMLAEHGFLLAPNYDQITQGCRINASGQPEVYALDEATVLANQEAAKQRANDSIKQQIAEIERGQARAIREATLTGETSYLAQIEVQIVNLRAQLQ